MEFSQPKGLKQWFQFFYLTGHSYETVHFDQVAIDLRVTPGGFELVRLPLHACVPSELANLLSFWINGCWSMFGQILRTCKCTGPPVSKERSLPPVVCASTFRDIHVCTKAYIVGGQSGKWFSSLVSSSSDVQPRKSKILCGGPLVSPGCCSPCPMPVLSALSGDNFTRETRRGNNLLLVVYTSLTP